MPRRASLNLERARAKVEALHKDSDFLRLLHEVRNAVHCSRCGRALTDEESKTRGIGPECLTKQENEDND